MDLNLEELCMYLHDRGKKRDVGGQRTMKAIKFLSSPVWAIWPTTLKRSGLDVHIQETGDRGHMDHIRFSRTPSKE